MAEPGFAPRLESDCSLPPAVPLKRGGKSGSDGFTKLPGFSSVWTAETRLGDPRRKVCVGVPVSLGNLKESEKVEVGT